MVLTQKKLSLCHKFNFLILISLEPDNVHLWNFKLSVFDRTGFIDWNIKGLWHCVAKISKLENKSLWQTLNFLVEISKMNISILCDRFNIFYIKQFWNHVYLNLLKVEYIASESLRNLSQVSNS